MKQLFLLLCLLSISFAGIDGKLINASKNGELNKLETAFREGANINAEDYHGWTALHKAASNGHINIVAWLLAHGAKLNTKDRFGWTPVERAAKNGQTDVVKYLLSRGARVENAPLLWRSLEDQPEMITLLKPYAK